MTDAAFHLGPEELDLWLDGRLPGDRTSHLETCPRCSAEAAQVRNLIHTLEALPKLSPGASLADRVMGRVTVAHSGNEHLTADETDQWMLGTLTQDRQRHLLSCSQCRTVADADRVLVRQLEALPRFAPAQGFAQRVLAHVDVPVVSLAGAWRLWKRQVATNPLGVAVSAGVAVLLGGAVAGSAAWAAGNQDLILGAGSWLRSIGEAWAWQWLAMAQTYLAEAPWFAALRGVMTPARLATAGLVVTGLYAAGVLALRRLIALPEARIARTAP